jgi:GT2 family glycosyltransferase
VSVLTPAYNSGRYLGGAIESVLAQDWHDFELIVVDDGSTDDTARVARSFSDPRVRVVTQSNRGECGARNTALRLARGELVGFLDADDTYLPGALSGLAGYLASHPDVDVVYSSGWFTDASGARLFPFRDHRSREPEGDVLEAVVAGESLVVSICCTMVRRRLLTAHRLEFDESLPIGGDWDFWIRTARVARFGYLDQETCTYRVHGSNVTSATDLEARRRHLARIRTAVVESEWFDELGLPTRTLVVRNLLVGVQGLDSTGQGASLQLDGVKRLPPSTRARLLRWVATDHIRRGGDLVFARVCLMEATGIMPRDWKARTLLAGLSASPGASRWLSARWGRFTEARKARRGRGRRQARPAPDELAPSAAHSPPAT